jgi:glucose-6-phosphate dehydrogenase assembly protein OpcA
MSERQALFESGAAVEVAPARIEVELDALWRRAAEPRDGEKVGPVTRACLWNLIVRVGGEEFRAAKRLVNEVVAQVPARAVVVRSEPKADESSLKAWVEANWRKSGHGLVGSDEVTLFATGDAAERVPSLVRSLMVPDAPTAMLWVGPPPAVDAPVRALLREVDRLIYDSRKLTGEEGLADFVRYGRELPDLECADLAWLGVRPLRGLCAALFDPPADPRRLERLDRVFVASGVRSVQTRALLTLGWLGARLGWQGYQRLADGEGGVRRWRAERRAGGEVIIELATRSDGPGHGVAALELEAEGARWTLTRDACIEVRGPGLPPRTQPARSHSDAELAISALGPRGRDPVYREALAHAARLVGA